MHFNKQYSLDDILNDPVKKISEAKKAEKLKKELKIERKVLEQAKLTQKKAVKEISRMERIIAGTETKNTK